MKTSRIKITEAGSTIAVAMFTILLLGDFVALAVDYTGNIGRNAQRDRVFANAVEVGDGCFELAFGSWRKLSATAENPATTVFNAIPTPSPGDFPSFPGAVISNFKVQAVDPLVTLKSDNPPISALEPSATPPRTTGPGTGTFSFLPKTRHTLTRSMSPIPLRQPISHLARNRLMPHSVGTRPSSMRAVPTTTMTTATVR